MSRPLERSKDEVEVVIKRRSSGGGRRGLGGGRRGSGGARRSSGGLLGGRDALARYGNFSVPEVQ